MSLTQSGDEIERVHLKTNVSPGGLTENVHEIQATEERRLVGIHLSKQGDNGRYELSFSSASNLGTSFSSDNTKSATIAMNMESENGIRESDNIDVAWAEGEEIHVHSTNNSGSGNVFTLVLYYREV